MYRATVQINKPGFERKFSFDFPQTIARDEVLQKVFHTNKSYKETLKSHPDDEIYPDVFITWNRLDEQGNIVGADKQVSERNQEQPDELDLPADEAQTSSELVDDPVETTSSPTETPAG